MFRQIVVGVDGRAGGRDAIALARLLVAAGGELTLAHVVSGDAHASRGARAAYEAPEAEQAEALLETVREKTGVEAHLRWRGSSSVGRGLHELCELIGADLVAVGSSRRALLGRVLIGDDTSAALNGAPCSIAIAPTNYAQQPGAMREIGVGYDGCSKSEHVLSLARMLAGASVPSSHRSRLCRSRQTPSLGQARSITRPDASSRMPAGGSQRSVTSSRARPTVSLPRS